MSEMIFSENCKVAKFKAPEGDNYRKIVKDYMMKMADIEWTPKETFSIKWKGEPRFKIDLTYEKGVTYHGMTYTDTKGTLDMFEQLLENGEITPNSEYYEECFGNHCSASMDMAYQQILDFPYIGTVKPIPREVRCSSSAETLSFPQPTAQPTIRPTFGLSTPRTTLWKPMLLWTRAISFTTATSINRVTHVW